MYNYIVLVDESGKPYIAHANEASSGGSSKSKGFGKGRGWRERVKYIAKWGEGAKARYFYTKEQLEAAMQQGRQRVSDASQKAREKASDAYAKGREVLAAGKQKVSEITTKVPERLKDTVAIRDKATGVILQGKEAVKKIEDNAKRLIDKAKDAGSESKVLEKASTAKEIAEDLARRAREKAKETADKAKEKVSETYSKARDAVDEAKDNLSARAGEIKDNVDSKLGELKDNFPEKAKETVEKAKEKASETVGKAKDKVSDVAESIKDKAGVDERERLYDAYDKFKDSDETERYEAYQKVADAAREYLNTPLGKIENGAQVVAKSASAIANAAGVAVAAVPTIAIGLPFMAAVVVTKLAKMKFNDIKDKLSIK